MSHEPGYSEPEYDAVYYSYYNQLWKNGATHFQAEYCAEVLAEQACMGTLASTEDQAVLKEITTMSIFDSANADVVAFNQISLREQQETTHFTENPYAEIDAGLIENPYAPEQHITGFKDGKPALLFANAPACSFDGNWVANESNDDWMMPTDHD